MAVKKNNKQVLVTLTRYHMRKLDMLQKRTGLSRSGIVQRLIEQQELFGPEEKELRD